MPSHLVHWCMTENALPTSAASDTAEAQVTPEQFLEAIDNEDGGLPPLPLEPLLTVWSITDAEVAGELALILTFANAGIPTGFPFLIQRDRALMLASQIRKHCQGGGVPQIATPPNAGKLILPNGAPA